MKTIFYGIKNFIFKLELVFTIILFLFSVIAHSQQQKLPDNKKCLKCHGKYYFQFYNDVLSKDIHKRMNPYFIINKDLYRKGVHRTFECTDCHEKEYEIYPHAAELKLESKFTCQDCHSGDEDFAKYHFDEIELEVQKSIHGKEMGEEARCEMCHNPHYYELNARNKNDIRQIVEYSNHMCLNCHNYKSNRFYLLSDSIAVINEKSHPWLPNHELHFKTVRCIECHAEYNDSLMVAHNILEKEKAVKKCVECHSSNSLLTTSLYKHTVKESRNKLGFINGTLMNEAFVIGANRNYYLNVISIVAFSLTVLLILIHLTLRIIYKK
ncbi:MAG: hypothetical protein ACM3PT_13875 [Deltaproteobacteria bacterium]